MSVDNLYEEDFHAWCFEQAEALEAGEFSSLDLQNLSEEIQQMGRGEKRELRSHLIVLFCHLIKLRYQPGYENKASWVRSIREQRVQIDLLMLDSPSLKYSIDEIAVVAYQKGLEQAREETGIEIEQHSLNDFMTLRECRQAGWLPGE